MIDRIRARLSDANVMATIAVFIALGGSSYAAGKLNGSSIKKHTIAGKKLRHDTLTGRQIRESRLGAVPYARNAGRLDGVAAAGLKLRCPSDTFPIADVCVEIDPVTRHDRPMNSVVISPTLLVGGRVVGFRFP